MTRPACHAWVLPSWNVELSTMERRGPGRPSRGDRAQVNVKLPRSLLAAMRERATRGGLTLTDYIGALAAADTGVDYTTQPMRT